MMWYLVPRRWRYSGTGVPTCSVEPCGYLGYNGCPLFFFIVYRWVNFNIFSWIFFSFYFFLPCLRVVYTKLMHCDLLFIRFVVSLCGRSVDVSVLGLLGTSLVRLRGGSRRRGRACYGRLSQCVCLLGGCSSLSRWTRGRWDATHRRLFFAPRRSFGSQVTRSSRRAALTFVCMRGSWLHR
jgi:hypothetical protein